MGFDRASVSTVVGEAIANFRDGKMVILVDDASRENEGDLSMAASKVTPQSINFMAKEGRGLICLAMAPQLADALELPLMTEENTSPFKTAFTVSIDAREGVTTGISASDRAKTVLTTVTPGALPKDFVRPGHIFPLRAHKDGVLARGGQTEASVDLTILAGMPPAAVICEIMRDDGTMARLPDLEEFASKHGLCILSIEALVRYRRQKDSTDKEDLRTGRLEAVDESHGLYAKGV